MEGIALSILPIVFYNFFRKIKGKEYNKKLNIGLIVIAIALFVFSIMMKKMMNISGQKRYQLWNFMQCLRKLQYVQF